MASSSLPLTMRAWQFTSTHGGLEKNLTLNSSAALPPHSVSDLGKDKVLVQVLFTALNPVDYKIAELPVMGRLAIRRPSSPGLDFAGRVAASGSQSDFKVGQLVFGRLDQPTQFGALAEYTVARTGALVAVPEGVQAQDAACVGTAGLTAYQSIVPNVKEGNGNRVFINGGSGGTGVWGIQIAKALGCYVVTSCSSKNAELCKSLGADRVVDYNSEDVVEALTKIAADSSSGPGRKFDLLVDNVGASGRLYWNCHHFTSHGARYVQVGAEFSGHSTLDLVMKMGWPGFLGGGKRKFHMLSVKSDKRQLEQIGRWMSEGKAKAVVDQVLRMEDAPKAFEQLKKKHTRGKILVAVSE
ncbi:uncharacterized protein Z518_03992 [Rhinocladiella mackenziei CBS 650.93]|uniref:Enoyl reductase (ER) domain-containing protein n=1 Tax=Rhinocladiella mackenziei CBS 650.93 TaxID=1442369 RepID=A0A0D2H6M4_9EURO|nr:uncharacterized protein Z518_03992 [Rhinocladiella mackenziei CBS 650.93]KIX06018.1 hypothetical protein Z518_03992 [Rhinocladiella mackenziei CBS 650.93]